MGRGSSGVGEFEGSGDRRAIAGSAGVLLTKTWKRFQQVVARDLYFSFDRTRVTLSRVVKDFTCLWMPSNALHYRF